MHGVIECSSEGFDRLDEGEVFDQFNESYGIASRVGTEALEAVPFGINEEGWRLFLAEWAEALPAFASPLELNVGGYHVEYGHSILQVTQVIVLESWHGIQGFPKAANSRWIVSRRGSFKGAI